MHAERSQLKERLQSGFRRFLLMFLYLLVVFSLFQLHEYVILREHGISYTRFGFGLIKALVLAKVMLIGDEMKLGRRLSGEPLVYVIVGKSVLFTILFVAFDFLEQAARAIFTGKAIAQSLSDPGGSLLGSLIVATIICVMLTPYFAFVEVERAFGADKLAGLLLRRGAIGLPANERG